MHTKFLTAAAAVLLAGVTGQSAFAQAKKSAKITRTTTTQTTRTTTTSAGGRLTTSLDSLSYGIGASIAQSLRQQNLTNINTDALARGIREALADGPKQLSAEQAQQVVMTYMQKQFTAKQADQAKAAEGNKKVGATFLAENKAKAGVTTTASGLQYVVVKEGTGPKPTANDKVKVHYTGKLLDGKVFDSSVERGQPAEFPVTGVIKGWVEALQLMPVGSKWTLYIPSDLAYGDRGAGEDIKPGSTLVFDVELLDIVK